MTEHQRTLARADRLLSTAVGSAILTAVQAKACRKMVVERLAMDKDCRLGRIFVSSGLISPAQLHSLLCHDTYQRERRFSKLVLQHAIQLHKVTGAAARAALEVQKTEYKQVGGTIPLLDCVMDEGIMSRACFHEVVEDLRSLMEERASSDSPSDAQAERNPDDRVQPPQLPLRREGRAAAPHSVNVRRVA